MKVKATADGYYDNKRRKPGVEFTLLDPKHFSKAWMIESSKAPKLEAALPAKGKGKVVESKDESVI